MIHLQRYLHAILVQQQPLFKHYSAELRLPTTVQTLPLTKTIQYPASAINADEGQNDGNWQVLENMLDQSGVPDNRLEEEISLVHGDLTTKERLDALWKMHIVEHLAKNWLNFVVFVPGLFHLKMTAMDAFWGAHVELSAGCEDPTSFVKYICHL